jgi:hypothetical protein
MSMQTRHVEVRIPVLTAYNRPLFIHHMQAILGQAFQGMSLTIAEGKAGETISVEVPAQIIAKDIVGYAKACLRSIGVDGEPELTADK